MPPTDERTYEVDATDYRKNSTSVLAVCLTKCRCTASDSRISWPGDELQPLLAKVFFAQP